MRILYNGKTPRSPAGNSGPAATVAQVTFSERAGFGAVGAAEHRGLPVFAPRGLAYRPCEGDNLLLFTADGAAVCGGVLSAADGLAPGELRLASSGGACIYLKANGDILLNGVTITKAGKIVTPA